MIEADRLGQLRTGAASGVAALHLARDGASSIGLIGCGWQAESQLAAIRSAVPTLDRAVAWCRTPDRLAGFCEKTAAEPAESAQDAAACDVVVTATTAKDPVLRGEWLAEGALVCAIGANDPSARELDNRVLERASFVCCDSIAQAKLESGDLIEPIATGTLDWLEVHELHEVVAGETSGRAGPRDIVLFKSNGIAAWDVAIGVEAVARARAAGVGRDCSQDADSGFRRVGRVPAHGLHDFRSVEQALALFRREPVDDVFVLEDLGQRPPAVVLADDVLRDPLLLRRPLEQEREHVAEGHGTIVSSTP